ncbi:MAG: hypothetical protein U5O39_16845 [Gammaproteobacteria bacterium]|nr:hypothetical protein [Gammaproteobacteria bacterium]
MKSTYASKLTIDASRIVVDEIRYQGFALRSLRAGDRLARIGADCARAPEVRAFRHRRFRGGIRSGARSSGSTRCFWRLLQGSSLSGKVVGEDDLYRLAAAGGIS